MKTNRILVIDDIAELREQLIEALAMIFDKYSFIEAQDGKEALRMLVKYKPDLLFLDVDMPVMNGLDCLQRIRLNQNKSIKNISIIMCTANQDSELIKKIMKLGVNDYLLKPYDIHLLIEKAGKYLDI